jgi:hypothetical protein
MSLPTIETPPAVMKNRNHLVLVMNGVVRVATSDFTEVQGKSLLAFLSEILPHSQAQRETAVENKAPFKILDGRIKKVIVWNVSPDYRGKNPIRIGDTFQGYQAAADHVGGKPGSIAAVIAMAKRQNPDEPVAWKGTLYGVTWALAEHVDLVGGRGFAERYCRQLRQKRE